MKQVVAKRKDIAFYIKLFPLQSIHPDAYGKSLSILCEKSNKKALELLEDAFAKKEILQAKCESTVVDENIKLGRALGVKGTPAMIFEDGSKVSGSIKAEEIIQRATGGK